MIQKYTCLELKLSEKSNYFNPSFRILILNITEDSQLQWNQSKQVQIAKYNHYAIIGIAIHILVLILFASGFQKNSECMTCNSTI